jgi:ADP-heptose:LPS heptosyltransferase
VFHGASNAEAIKLVPVPMRHIECDFTNPLTTLATLRGERLDLIVDLMPWARLTAIYCRLSSAVAIGFDVPEQHRSAAFDVAVPHFHNIHECDNHARMAALFSNRPYAMKIRTHALRKREDLEVGRLVLCHVAAGGGRAMDKAWPVENWARLARLLAERGWQIGFTGIMADAPLVERILSEAALPRSQALSLCGMPLGQVGN